jgi:hypothetical protein
LRARAPASVVWCFIGAADAVSGAAVGVLWPWVVGGFEGADAGAWCVGDVVEGSADSRVPVMDRKPASLAEIMVMAMRCGRMAAGALVACWVQCAADVVLCVGR